MTVQEAERKVRNEDALEYCKKQSMLEQMVGNEIWKHYHYASEALEEVEQYRALGTVEELKEAREKQVAKKPTYKDYEEDDEGEKMIPYKAECPTCGYEFEFGTWNDEDNHHCKCGQALKWGEEDD